MAVKRSDIDATRTALRPRMVGPGAGSTSVPYHQHANVPVHTHSADAITVAPAGAIAADDVQEALEELDSEKLARDGSQTMLGALDLNHHDLQNANDADIEGTATIGVDAGVGRDVTAGRDASVTRDLSVGDNVTLTGASGAARVSGVRQLHLSGDDLDGEALIDGAERVVFNNEPTKSVIQNPSVVQFNPVVTPATDLTDSEGNLSWSSIEHVPESSTDITGVRGTLGWVMVRWNAPSNFGPYCIAWYDGTIAHRYTTGPDWASTSYLPPFGISLNGIESAGPAWFMQRGIIRGLDTSSWPAGTILWANGLSEILSSGASATPPPTDDGSAPLVCLGVVRVSDAVAGVLEVDVRAYAPHNSLLGRNEPGAHLASVITNSPTGSLVATDVQAAIDALEAQKTGRRWSYAMKGF